MSALARRLDRAGSVLAPPTARPRIIFGMNSADAEAKLADLRKGGFDGPVMVIRWLDRTEGTDHAISA